MLTYNPTKQFVAAVIAGCIAAVGSGLAARAATVVTSTTVAAAPATTFAATQPAPATPPRWLGLAMEKIPPIFSRLLGLQAQQGLLIIQVIPNSPAFKAHLKPGDLVVTLNGHPLLNPYDLIHAENRRGAVPPTLSLSFIRDGIRKSAMVTPVDRPPHLIFFISRRPGPAGVLPTGTGSPDNIQPTSLMTVGPGVKLHLPAGVAAPGANARPDLLTVKQWMDPHGTRHLQIIWRSHTYNIQPGRMGKLPPPVQAVARMVLQRDAMMISTGRPLSPEAAIQQRLVELRALIQRLQLQEKQLQQEATKYAPAHP